MKLYYRVSFFAIFILVGTICLKLYYLKSFEGWKKVEGVNDPVDELLELFLPMTLFQSFLNSCELYLGKVESVGRIASTAIAFPLVLEYLLDQTITWLNPTLRESGTFEDPLAHGLILSALLFSTHLPILFLGESKAFAKDLFIPLSRFLTVAGVFGKLNNFATDIWNNRICVTVLLYYLFLQLLIVISCEFNESGHIHVSPLFQRLNSGFGCLGLILILYIGMKLRHIYDTNHIEQGHHFFVTKQYLCTVVTLGLFIYEASLVGLTIAFMIAPSSYDVYLGIALLSFLCMVIILTVLPARVIRRSIAAVEHKLLVQKEIDLKNTFVRYVSHEIRSPLSTTSLGIDCLHTRLTTALATQQKELHVEELLELVRDCRISCAAAEHTLNDMLLFDKLENNMLQLEKKETKCEEFLEDCIRPFVRQLRVAGLQFHANIDPRLRECMMTCDVFKMAQVVRNLVSNAVKFTPLNGSVTVNATVVEDSKHTAKLQFEVNDTGPGISKENQLKLFQQYVQINAAALQGGKGSGLGLWICDAIIRLHDGKIGVSSRGEGYGSTFYFEIPVTLKKKTVAEEEENEEEYRKSPLSDSQVIPGKDQYRSSVHIKLLNSERIFKRSPRSCSVSVVKDVKNLRVIDLPQGLNPPFSLNNSEAARKMKVLIADDSVLTRKMVERMLRPFDMNIYHCNNGKDAADEVLKSLNLESPPTTPLSGEDDSERNGRSPDQRAAYNPNSLPLNPSTLPSCTPFDIVIIDYMMPGLDGAEAIGKMREGGFKGFICAVTGSSFAEDQGKLYNSGASIIMLKPFNVKPFFNHMIKVSIFFLFIMGSCPWIGYTLTYSPKKTDLFKTPSKDV